MDRSMAAAPRRRGPASSSTRRGLAGLVVLFLVLMVRPAPVGAAEPQVLSPAHRHLEYDAGPFTSVNVTGLVGAPCNAPQGCDIHPLDVQVPDGWYANLRRHGQVGVVRIALTWPDNANDFDLLLTDQDGNPIASSGFGNSDFERITYTQLPTGHYEIRSVVFRANQVPIHVDVDLMAMTPQATAARPGGSMVFSSGAPVTLERSSGEPHLSAAPDGDLYVDFPLGAGTNSILFTSTDGAATWKPLAPLHPNNNPLFNNAAGGGDAWTAVGPDGRVCFSELNTLLSLAIGCSTDVGTTFAPADPLVVDPQTPLVDRQWQAATPQGEQFIGAEYGILTAGQPLKKPGIRVFKEAVTGTSTGWHQVLEIATGKAMKSYNFAVDPTDTDADGGTVIGAYLQSNQGDDKAENPHELMVWRTTDGGTTFDTHKVADLPTTPGNNFATVATDTAGNVYVAWTEQGTWDVFYSVAPKDDLDHWSTPVRINADPAATAIQPTIAVGDPGRVFVVFYGTDVVHNPDSFPAGHWDAYLANATDGACQLDGSCHGHGPHFHQTKVNDHPLQYRGICLGGTACGGDPYYGDRSMLEYPWVTFDPDTGQAIVVVTDSSREDGHTTITTYQQTAGPAAFADKPDIAADPRVSDHVTDPVGDAGWPYASAVPMQQAPGADLTDVRLSYPDDSTLRVQLTVADPSQLDQALAAGAGQDLLVAARFATSHDVLFAGLRDQQGQHTFVAGHLAPAGLLDAYVPDDGVTVDGSIDPDTGTITIDVPLDELTTTFQQPADASSPAPTRQAITAGDPLYTVTGFAITSPYDVTNPTVATHLLDITPSFRLSAQHGPLDHETAPAPHTGPPAADTVVAAATLPTTGAPGWTAPAALLLLGAVALLARRRHAS